MEFIARFLNQSFSKLPFLFKKALILLLSLCFFSCDQAAKDYASSVKVVGSIANNVQSSVEWSVASQSTQKSAAATLQLTAKLSTASKLPVTLPFTISGSAVLNSDFTVTSVSSVVIPAGQTTASLSITIINDGLAGPNKNIIFTAGTPMNSSLGGVKLHTLTIINDITVGLAIVASASSVEGSPASFTVTLTPASLATVTVNYSTSNGTAIAGTHYTLNSGTLTFNPGTTTRNINVATTDLGVYFPVAKTYSVTLSGSVSSTITSAVANGLITSNHPQPSVQWTLATQSSNKSAAATLTVTAQLSATSGVATSVPFTLGGSATLSTDYSISPASPISIAAGSTTATTTVTILNDSVAGSNKTITLTMVAPINASLGATSLQTITIVNDLIGAFAISGVTGVSDSTLDAYLNLGLNPTVNWGTATNASSYDVTVYQNDGTTLKCALINTASTSYAFSSCGLTAGQTYKAKVTAKGTAPSVNATNNFYSFFVNSPPTPAVIATRFVMMNSSVATDVVTGASCAFAGCTISIVSTASGAFGTTTFTGNNITYTPNASFTGADSFSYVIQDGRGGQATGTMNVKVMSAFTWTGGGGNTSWATTNNWCGSVNAGNTACVGGPQPSTTDAAVFDSTCSANCSATIDTNIDVGALYMYAGYTGTITQAAGFTIKFENTNSFSQAAGTFLGGNSNITLNGSFAQSGGSFTSTSATLALNSSLAIGATSTFVHHSGSLIFSNSFGVASVTTNATNFNNVSFTGYFSGYNLIDNMTVNGTLLLDDGHTNHGSLNGSTIFAKANIVVNNYGFKGSTLIKINGSGNQTITSVATASLPSLEVASTGGTVTYSGNFLFLSNYSYTSGTVVTTGTTLQFSSYFGSATLTPGPINYNNVSFTGYYSTYTLVGTFNVNGTLVFDDGHTSRGNLLGGTILAKGDISSLEYGYNGTTLLRVVGSTNQTISGVSGANFLSTEIASTAGTITYSGNLTFGGDYIYTSGSVSLAGSVVQFNHGTSAATITPGAFAYSDVNFSGGGATYTLNGTMTVNGTLTLSDYAYYGNYSSINTGTVLAKGNIVTSNYGMLGSGHLRLAGAGNQTVTGVASAKILNFEIASTAGTVTLAGSLQFAGDYLYTSGAVNASTSSIQFYQYTTSASITPGAFAYQDVTFTGYGATYNLNGILNVNGTLTLGDNTYYSINGVINGGTIVANGNVIFNLSGYGGTAALTFAGTSSSSLNVSAGAISMSGQVTLNKMGGAVLTMGSAVSFNSTAQNMNITSGSINMAGFNLTLQSLTMSGGTSISRNSGILTVNGAGVGAGPYSGGSIAN